MCQCTLYFLKREGLPPKTMINSSIRTAFIHQQKQLSKRKGAHQRTTTTTAEAADGRPKNTNSLKRAKVQRTFIKEKCRKGKRRRRRICRRIRNEFYWGRRFFNSSENRGKNSSLFHLHDDDDKALAPLSTPIRLCTTFKLQIEKCRLPSSHSLSPLSRLLFSCPWLAESLFSALNVRSPGRWTAFADETEVGNKLAIAAGGVNVRKGRTKKGGRHKQERQTQHFTPRS